MGPSGLHHNQDEKCPMCEQKLSQAHPELAKWYREQVKVNFPDAHISWSYRNQDDQEKAFLDGKTELHYPNSAHNKMPAMALDLFEIDHSFQALFSPKFYSAVNSMNNGVTAKIKWGGVWKSLGDSDHFELDSSMSS